MERIHVDAGPLAVHLLGLGEGTTRPLFARISEGTVNAQTSSVSVFQVLVEAYRAGKPKLAAEVQKTLLVQRRIQLVDVTPDIALQAAEVRAQLGGRPERAIQLATALVGGADTFVTTGSNLRRIAGMRIQDIGRGGPV